MTYLHSHLSFVFHRFSARENGFDAVDIVVNGMKLKAVDPFLKANSFTQPLEGQEIRIGNELISVQPYILPHMSHLDFDQASLAGGKEGLRGNQGFYIYRSRRLVIWGTWFRLVPKEEFYKLTRVQVDIPNTLDHLWALDIKKSAAYPPDIIRNRLKQLIPHFANTSRTTITYPGRKEKSRNNFDPLWERIEPSHGSFRYDISPVHPAVRKFSETLDPSQQKGLQHLLDLISSALPFEAIYSDMCSDRRTPASKEQLDELLSICVKLLEVTDLDLNTVLTLDPVARYPQHHEAIRKELVK